MTYRLAMHIRELYLRFEIGIDLYPRFEIGTDRFEIGIDWNRLGGT